MPHCSGSYLGAERHFGVIPFGEKDVDVAIFFNNRRVHALALASASAPAPNRVMVRVRVSLRLSAGYSPLHLSPPSYP